MNHQELVRMAHSQPLLSKEKAAALIKELAAGIRLGDYDLAGLYKFFLPRPTPATKLRAAKKDGDAWASLAVAKGDARQCLNWLYRDNEFVVGCDGHRLHLIKESQAVPGYYTAFTHELACTASEIGTPGMPPKYPSNIMDLLGGYGQAEHRRLGDLVPDPVEHVAGRLVVDVGGVHCNNLYWEQAAVGFDDDADVFLLGGGTPQIKIESGNRTAIVLGVRK